MTHPHPSVSRSPHRGLARVLLALVIATAPGCSTARPSYSARTLRPHKDVVVLIVLLDEPLDVDGYLDIVESELGELDLATRDPHVPVWEARFEFLLSPRYSRGSSERLASVSLFAGAPDGGEPERTVDDQHPALRDWHRRITIY